MTVPHVLWIWTSVRRHHVRTAHLALTVWTHMCVVVPMGTRERRVQSRWTHAPQTRMTVMRTPCVRIRVPVRTTAHVTTVTRVTALYALTLTTVRARHVRTVLLVRILVCCPTRARVRRDTAARRVESISTNAIAVHARTVLRVSKASQTSPASA